MRISRSLSVALFALFSWRPISFGEEQANLPVLYPFVKDGRWGYIDSSGAWIIEPRFERCFEIFEGHRVRVFEGKKLGYIDRKGQWIVQPQFTSLGFGRPGAQHEVVQKGSLWGILEHSGKLILPLEYEDITLFEDRAWVLKNQKLGVFSLDGNWILRPSLSWPRGRLMPYPTSGGVSWFKRGNKWGLVSSDGKVLFQPQFLDHELGRHESEEWTHPEGLDFENDRAWVIVDGRYWLITSEGIVIARHAFEGIRPWTNDLYVFVDRNKREGLVSRDGEIKLPGRFFKITALNEGRAVVAEQRERKTEDGQVDTWWTYGYIDDSGNTIVEPGTYLGPGQYSGGQTELAPFSEGLAPVWNNAPGDTHDPYAGYIDKSGTLVIPEQFYYTRSFAEGLGAFLERKKLGDGLSPGSGLWGYLDPLGKIAIKPQFGWTTPFCRGRAWVQQPGASYDSATWAMINKDGKVLTEFAYDPPERRTRWVEGGDYVGSEHSPKSSATLSKIRWRGNLAVVSRHDFHHGLATADGQILVEPMFNTIREFRDGISIAIDSRGRDKKGNVVSTTALITEGGKILAHGTYSHVRDFDGGVAWATRRWADSGHRFQDIGWVLIDTSAAELTQLTYVEANWIQSQNHEYRDDLAPRFNGELAPVALAESYERYGDNVWELNSWGYINRSGKIVAWRNRSTK